MSQTDPRNSKTERDIIELCGSIFLNHIKYVLSDAAYYNSLTCLDPSVSTQLVGWRIKGDAQSWGQIEILLHHSWWRSETEALKEGGEEEEELHPCQTLTDTRPAT